MSIIGNFIQKAISSLKTDRDVPVGVSDPGDERGALHTMLKGQGTASNNPLYVLPVSGSGSASLATQTIAHTITPGQVNTWQIVPVAVLLNIFQVDVYDSTNTFPINIAYRISNSNVLEIFSASAQTYTLRIIGAS